MVLALSNSSHGPLSVYQVSLNFLVCCGQIFIAKLKKGSNSVNTIDRVMVLALCNSPYGPLSVYQVSLNYFQYF